MITHLCLRRSRNLANDTFLACGNAIDANKMERNDQHVWTIYDLDANKIERNDRLIWMIYANEIERNDQHANTYGQYTP